MAVDLPLFRRCARWLLAAGAGICLAGCASLVEGPVRPAPQVDLDSYMGDWFVIAALSGAPHDCQRPIERYLLYSDGQIQTTFLCLAGGKLVAIKGMATVTDTKTNAVWTLSTGGTFSKPRLMILYVAPDYHYAVVSTPSRAHAWILSRTRQMAAVDYAAAVGVLKSNGISTRRLTSFAQP